MSPFAPSGFEVFITLFCSCVILLHLPAEVKRHPARQSRQRRMRCTFGTPLSIKNSKLETNNCCRTVYLCAYLRMQSIFFLFFKSEGRRLFGHPPLICCAVYHSLCQRDHPTLSYLKSRSLDITVCVVSRN